MATSKKAPVSKTKPSATKKTAPAKAAVKTTPAKAAASPKLKAITTDLLGSNKTITINVIVPSKNKLFIADIKETRTGYEITAVVGTETVAAVGPVVIIKTPPPPPPPVREMYNKLRKDIIKLGYINI